MRKTLAAAWAGLARELPGLVWVAALTALAVSLIGLTAGRADGWSGWQLLYYLSYTAGESFLLLLLATLALALILSRAGGRRWSRAGVCAIVFGALVWALCDSYVFGLFRLRLNLAMIEMVLFGQGQIVPWSGPLLLAAAGRLILLLAAVAAIIALAPRLARHAGATRAVGVLLLSLFLLVEAVHAVAFARGDTGVLVVAERAARLPPLRFSGYLSRLGWRRGGDDGLVEVSGGDRGGLLSYPLSPLRCPVGERPPDIIFIYVDALRYDALNERDMPRVSAFAASPDTSVFGNFYSGGNSTRHGIFSVFYGLPGSYWKAALAGRTPSVLIQALRERDYQIGTFAGAPLTRPEFDRTVFAGVPGLRLRSPGDTCFERDRASVDEFLAWREGLDPERPYFGFLFLDSAHAWATPTDEPEHVIHEPYAPYTNYLALGRDTDPTPFYNGYRNAVHWIDGQIGRALDRLERSGALERAIVLISSDHGEEFNDNGLGYWAHNGNYSDVQLRVPLIVRWPGRGSRRFSHLTSAADITATLLPEALGCLNPVSDYSVGASLWAERRERPWFHAASYSSNAFVEPGRVTLIDRFGLLSYTDHRARPLSGQQIPPYLARALDDLGRFYRR